MIHGRGNTPKGGKKRPTFGHDAVGGSSPGSLRGSMPPAFVQAVEHGRPP